MCCVCGCPRRLRDKADTRAAAVVETLKTSANIFTNNGGDAAGADGDGASRRPRRTRSKRHLASADSDDDLHAAAAATAGASAAAGPDGAPTKASLPRKAPPFWETFLFGAQTEEFDVAAKVTLTKMHGKENGKGKSKSNGHKNGAAAEREGLLGHGHGPATRNPLLAAPVQVQEPPRRASLTQRLEADDAFTVKVRCAACARSRHSFDPCFAFVCSRVGLSHRPRPRAASASRRRPPGATTRPTRTRTTTATVTAGTTTRTARGRGGARGPGRWCAP